MLIDSRYRLPLLHDGLPLPGSQVRGGAAVPLIRKCDFGADRIDIGLALLLNL
jgi:hypothetical protein